MARRDSTSAPMPRTKSKVLPDAPARRIIPIALNLPAPPIKSWSFSSLQDFTSCAHKSYLKRVLKEPEPERPLPPGKTEHANDRGSRMHDDAEMFIRGKLKSLPFELRAFKAEFESLRQSFKDDPANVLLEEEWGMSKDWEPAPYKTAWLRLKLDALFFISENTAIAVDYKSGRKAGNEAKHADQLQLYMLVAFLRYPKLEFITVELWYLDQDEITQVTFTRMQGLRFRRGWELKAGKMMNATSFPANPNMFSCRFCMYGPRGSEVCAVGVM